MIIGQFRAESDARKAGGKHQLGVGTVREAGKLDGGIEKCHR